MYASVKHQNPGVRDAYENVESVVQWGDPEAFSHNIMKGLLDGAARDSGHTGETHILRAGLALGYHKANKKWVVFDSTATADQGDVLLGILGQNVNVQIDGTNVDRHVEIVFQGPVKASAILLDQGTAGPLDGHATEAAARTALATRFVLDDFFAEY